MMTNTAGKIILILTIFTYGLGVIVTLAFPSNRVKNDILFCEYINPRDFYCFTLPVTVSVGLVLSVIVFGVFRGPKSENSSKDMRPKELGAALR